MKLFVLHSTTFIEFLEYINSISFTIFSLNVVDFVVLFKHFLSIFLFFFPLVVNNYAHIDSLSLSSKKDNLVVTLQFHQKIFFRSFPSARNYCQNSIEYLTKFLMFFFFFSVHLSNNEPIPADILLLHSRNIFADFLLIFLQILNVYFYRK